MTLRERLADVWRFALRPSYVAQPMAWGRAAALALVAVFALDLLVDTLVVELTLAWDGHADFLPLPLEVEKTLTEDLFEFLILAPVMEELAFRGWLTGRTAALRFGACGMAAIGMLTASTFATDQYANPMALAGMALVIVGLIHWLATRDRDTAVPSWFVCHFHWFVWGSTLLFGLIHLGNYAPLVHPLGLLAVLPQTIGGLLLAYVRTRIGLGAAIAHHAAYNAIFLAGDYGWW